MENLDVVCPGCRQSYHTTTKSFNPYKPVNGGMLRLKDPWRSWGWCPFGDDGRSLNIAERRETHYSSMDCPGCGVPLAPNGNVIVRMSDKSKWIKPPEEFYNPEPVVFKPDYSDLEAEWNERMKHGEGDKPETQYQTVKKLKDEGLSYAKIGEKVGLSKGRISQILKAGA